MAFFGQVIFSIGRLLISCTYQQLFPPVLVSAFFSFLHLPSAPRRPSASWGSALLPAYHLGRVIRCYIPLLELARGGKYIKAAQDLLGVSASTHLVRRPWPSQALLALQQLPHLHRPRAPLAVPILKLSSVTVGRVLGLLVIIIPHRLPVYWLLLQPLPHPHPQLTVSLLTPTQHPPIFCVLFSPLIPRSTSRSLPHPTPSNPGSSAGVHVDPLQSVLNVRLFQRTGTSRVRTVAGERAVRGRCTGLHIARHHRAPRRRQYLSLTIKSRNSIRAQLPLLRQQQTLLIPTCHRYHQVGTPKRRRRFFRTLSFSPCLSSSPSSFAP